MSEKLRMLREKLGYSQNDVAKLLGISRTAYVKYETGDSKPTRKLKELSEIFNVSLDYLMLDEKNYSASKNTEQILQDAFYLFKSEEIEHIKKYRQLSASGKKEIDNLIDFKLFTEKGESKEVQNTAV